MSYIKLKELTKYFDFHTEIPVDKLPNYVYQYVRKDEKVLLGYENRRDHAAFTDKTLILFDRTPIGSRKKIHLIPYSSISSGAILFTETRTEILLSLDSGYQMRINFIRMNRKKKENLKEIFRVMLEKK